MSPDTADVVIVGAGASGTHALLSLLEHLSSTAPAPTQPVRIVVIDRDPQFFAGVAYGNRSGRASLTLSTLTDFLPDDERARFSEWVAAHREVVQHPAVDSAWLERHLTDIAADRWDELFIPRRLYGAFLADRARSAMVAAQSGGIAEFALVTADVTAIDASNDGHRVSATDRHGLATQIDATALVLAIGSPPVRLLVGEDAGLSGDLVHDVYDPGLDATLAGLRCKLVDLPAEERRILVVGGNAAALEFLLASQEILRELGAVVTVLCPSGRPRHWRRKKADEVAELRAIAELKAKAGDGGRVTAAELYDAVFSDLRAAVDSGTDVAAVPEIAASIPFFLPSFSEAERRALAARYGLPISNLLRQDGGDAIDILESSVESGAVEFRAGRFLGYQREDGLFRVSATDDQGSEHILDANYGAVVGAMGFEGVSTTRAPLLQRMLQSGLVRPSSSDTGLRVDGRFRAAPRLFIVGPLLAGNVQGDMVIWHAESVRRIMAIARAVAPSIGQELNMFARGNALRQSPQA